MDHEPNIGDEIAKLYWVIDGVSLEELSVLDHMADLAPHRIEILERILEYDWLDDEFIVSEGRALLSLARLSSLDLELARQALDYEWVVDGITSNEARALGELTFLASSVTRSHLLDIDSRSPGLAASFGWLADGLNANEMRAFIGIAKIAQIAPHIYDRLLRYSWIEDGISQRESEAITDLYYAATENSEFARQIVRIGLLDDPIRDSDLYALMSLQFLVRNPDSLALLTNQPWFADGLDEEEVALLVVLSDARNNTDTLYRSLLQARSTRSTTISLPLAGEVEVWVFMSSSFPSSDDTLKLIEHAMRSSERIMGDVPFPTTDVIFLVGEPEELGRQEGYKGGYHAGGHVVISTLTNAFDIYHETAHYYYRGFPTWLTEGFAHFLAQYTISQVDPQRWQGEWEERVEGVLIWCRQSEGFRNIQGMLDFDKNHVCSYPMGAHFLGSLLLLLGEEVMSEALGGLYLQPALKGRNLTGEDIYRTFLNYTPPELKDDFRDLYRRLHGGPYVDIQD